MNNQPDGGTYISRRIVVTEILSRVGRVTDITILTAAILHQVFDCSQTHKLEFDKCFGSEARFLVQELTEDNNLAEPERMQALVVRAPQLSSRAKQIIVAEKICKLQTITPVEPADWSFEQKTGFMTWLSQVVAGCRGANPNLDHYFDELFQERINSLLHAA